VSLLTDTQSIPDDPEYDWHMIDYSGIYANKKGYHNTVNANLRNWPNNYSVQLPLDLVNFNRSKARAIDLTMSDSEMVAWTTRMKNSFENPLDSRLDAVKEFYGTLDNKNVFGLSKDSINGAVRSVTADKTHLWHGHTSIFTSFVDNWRILSPIISVWSGQSLADWEDDLFLPIQNDTGEEVKYWQQLHNEVRSTVTPASPQITVDGDYGAATATAFADFYHKHGGSASYKGEKVTGWLAIEYLKSLIDMMTPPAQSPNIDPEVLKQLVNAWLQANLPSQLAIVGNLTGKVLLP
jgi:hypothetical protein